MAFHIKEMPCSFSFLNLTFLAYDDYTTITTIMKILIEMLRFTRILCSACLLACKNKKQMQSWPQEVFSRFLLFLSLFLSYFQVT